MSFLELEGVDHRAILRDETVVAQLLDHVCLKVIKPTPVRK